MHTIERSSGQVIAADTQASIASINQAVIDFSRLCASIVEVSTSSGLPVSTAQKALATTAKGLTALVQGREDIAITTRELIKIQGVSSLDAVSFGCPDGLPPKTASAPADPETLSVA